MKNQEKFLANSLVKTALVAAVIVAGVVLALAQTGSFTSAIPTRYRQTNRSTPLTVTFKTLVNFDGTNGANPGRPPIQGTDGNLYGTANGGGANGQGVLFKLTPAGKLTTRYTFCSESGCADGSSPGALGLGADGNLYGGARAEARMAMARSSSSREERP